MSDNLRKKTAINCASTLQGLWAAVAAHKKLVVFDDHPLTLESSVRVYPEENEESRNEERKEGRKEGWMDGWKEGKEERAHGY